MPLSHLAGKPAPKSLLIDPARLEREFYARRPDPSNPQELVSFGTSGHRGSPLKGSFNEAHILAITQAICEYRAAQGITGPLYMGRDTHAVSGPAQRTALEVLAANGVETVIQRDDGVTPTPVVSRAILAHNRGRTQRLADGIVVTPSHNPPEDGGFKYNPPNGGPADTDVTGWIQDAGQRAAAGGQRRRPANARRDGSARRNDARGGLHRALRRGSGQRRRHGGDPGSAAVDRGRSAGRRRGALLGAHQQEIRPRHRHRQSNGRSDLRFHDGGP